MTLPRTCLVALGLVGCGFTAPGALPDAALDDAAVTIDAELPGDAPPNPPVSRCATADSALRLCVDFDDPLALAADHSPRNHTALLATGLATTMRGTARAGQLTPTSRLQFPEHADFEITQNLTVSLWMQANLPADAAWLLDNNTQYAMSYQPTGNLRCVIGNMVIDSALSLLDQSWHHVACTYDGEELRVYLDGTLQGCRELDTAITTSGNVGIAIGSNIGAGATFSEPYTGGIDDVQVFARRWTGPELCAAAGSVACTDVCPP